MKQVFKSPQEFNTFIKSRLRITPAQEKENITAALTEMCVFLTKQAKDKFGHYQTGWDELAPATQKDRVAKGYTPNDPLLRSGELRDSIKFTVAGKSAAVGSTSDIMVYQEKGTMRTGWSGKGIPPRPVFLLTQLEDGQEAVSLFFKTFMQLTRGEVS